MLRPISQLLREWSVAFALAVAAWIAFYMRFPDRPLSESEFIATFIVAGVGISLGRGLIGRLRR